mmetsp:Transcript_2828/g.6913  ORF Transcript_2828/g.6913 Transcript_2828/m.6913 type:complete len:218 (+) Transcript_2828:687-1340(+)
MHSPCGNQLQPAGHERIQDIHYTPHRPTSVVVGRVERLALELELARALDDGVGLQDVPIPQQPVADRVLLSGKKTMQADGVVAVQAEPWAIRQIGALYCCSLIKTEIGCVIGAAKACVHQEHPAKSRQGVVQASHDTTHLNPFGVTSDAQVEHLLLQFELSRPEVIFLRGNLHASLQQVGAYRVDHLRRSHHSHARLFVDRKEADRALDGLRLPKYP